MHIKIRFFVFIFFSYFSTILCSLEENNYDLQKVLQGNGKHLTNFIKNQEALFEQYDRSDAGFKEVHNTLQQYYTLWAIRLIQDSSCYDLNNNIDLQVLRNYAKGFLIEIQEEAIIPIAEIFRKNERHTQEDHLGSIKWITLWTEQEKPNLDPLEIKEIRLTALLPLRTALQISNSQE